MSVQGRSAVFAAALLALAAPGCASQPGPGGPRGGPEGGGPRFAFPDGKVARPAAVLFAGMDADQDRLVSAEEALDGIDAEWVRADADANGVVSAFELEDWAAEALGDRDATPGRIAFDRDLDGSISEVEFKTRLGEEFARFDADGDRSLRRAELLTALPSAGTAMAGGGGGPSGGGRRPPGGERPPRAAP